MKRLIAAILFAAAGALASTGPVEVEGVAFPREAQVGGQLLQLNGAGVRTRAFFKVYAAGLYVPQPTHSAAALLAQRGPRRVAMVMLRDVDGDRFYGALSDGLKANHSEQQLAGFKAQLEMLQANLSAIGAAKQGDRIDFEFIPDAGTRIVVNGQQKGRAIPGSDFFTAVLRNWLGAAPVDDDLKQALVGG